MIKFGMFNSVNGDRKYKAGDFASYFATFIGNGIFVNPSDCLQVIGNLDAMSVTLRPGKAWINGYYLTNDDDYSLTLDKGDTSLNRIDRIVVRLDFIERKMLVAVKKGALSASPIAPTLKRDADAYELALADVYVAKGALTVSQASITDTRLNKSLCGLMHGVVDQVDTTTIFNQYQSWFNNYSVVKAGEFLTWQTNVTTALEAWIDAQEKEFTQWRQAEEDLYYAWLQGRKDGFDSWFATIKDILDTNAAGNLQLQIDAHKDAAMPHKFKDAADGKTYQYGLQRNPELNSASFMYAETADDDPNIINLPTYEQVDDIALKVKATSGVVMGEDGSRYVGHFDDVYETYNAQTKDLTNMETFYRTFKEKVDHGGISFDVRSYGTNFLYLNERLRLIYGSYTVPQSSRSSVWYAVVDANTFEVLGGSLMSKESVAMDVYNARSDTYIAATSKYIAIKVKQGNTAHLLIIDINTFKFIRYQPLPNPPSSVTLENSNKMSILESGVVGFMLLTQPNPYFYWYVLNLGPDGIPNGTMPTEKALNLGNGSDPTKQLPCSLYTDGEFFYATIHQSGTVIRYFKLWHETVTNTVGVVAWKDLNTGYSYYPSGLYQNIKTLASGKRIFSLFCYTNDAKTFFKVSVDLDSNTQRDKMGLPNLNISLSSPMANGANIYWGSVANTAAIDIRGAKYLPFYEHTLTEDGFGDTKEKWMLAGNPATPTGDVRILAHFINNGIVNNSGPYPYSNGAKMLFPIKRSYNLINHVKVDD
ncbi:hypothetical protein [Viridibacillus arvi]|uniref:hypothetical protein n=1 Tax=Viridibacillus arvi TaxID=263475 RepID=UPI003D2C5230